MINELIARGALFVVNHSAGKDSQAMMIKLAQVVPAAQLVVVHAELPGADWPGLAEHMQRTVPAGIEIRSCRAIFQDGRLKTFLGMVEDRHAKNLAKGKDVSPWPAPAQRQCTSDLKRGPLEVLIRKIAKERGARLIVNCEGIRAAESTDRAKRVPFERHAALSKAGREVYNWLPIFELSTEAVFATIAQAGQQPHWAYGAGMSRLSCCFCILARESDLKTAATLRPQVYREYVELERATGKTFSMSRKTLEEITGVRVSDAQAA